MDIVANFEKKQDNLIEYWQNILKNNEVVDLEKDGKIFHEGFSIVEVYDENEGFIKVFEDMDGNKSEFFGDNPTNYSKGYSQSHFDIKPVSAPKTWYRDWDGNILDVKPKEKTKEECIERQNRLVKNEIVKIIRKNPKQFLNLGIDCFKDKDFTTKCIEAAEDGCVDYIEAKYTAIDNMSQEYYDNTQFGKKVDDRKSKENVQREYKACAMKSVEKFSNCCKDLVAAQTEKLKATESAKKVVKDMFGWR